MNTINIDLANMQKLVLKAVFETRTRVKPQQLMYRQSHWLLNAGFCQNDTYFKINNSQNAWRYRNSSHLHLYRPNVRVWEDTRSKPYAKLEGVTLLFKADGNTDFETKFDPHFSYYEFQDPEDTAKKLMRKAAKLNEQQGCYYTYKVHAAFIELLSLLLDSQHLRDNYYNLSSNNTSFEDNFSSQVQRFLKKNMTQKVSIAQLARYMHVSESQLYHRYKDENGESPIQTLLRIRIETAKSLLIQGLPLDSIAEHTGFYDAFHLSKSFKKKTGKSPRDFMKTL